MRLRIINNLLKQFIRATLSIVALKYLTGLSPLEAIPYQRIGFDHLLLQYPCYFMFWGFDGHFQCPVSNGVVISYFFGSIW